ncbi:hypothetical protein IVB40_01945 [Bradyrhizobium sp. 40]|uniref:hypothetical protein n=1 Tax=Bradyrhizobium sp. 40 TaxID=2782674 RepID=UPI001FFFE485|nr:hypothetical protein [Bradyrhizobium sp. 40]UPJ42863.1 hypothetical protein IVB40_01945 [Bradyrhizobium sp. 40]
MQKAFRVADRPSSEVYKSNVISELGFEDFQAAERAYRVNMIVAKQSATSGAVLGRVMAQLKSMPARYAPGRDHLLFYPALLNELELQVKPFDSVIDKLHRSNVLYNRHFPKLAEGTVGPAKFYEGVEDLLRTRLVCKYMDGPRFVCEDLKRFCDQNDVESKFRELSTDAGYYAWHYYFRVPVELMLNGAVVEKKMWVEIQLSTQLAEVITTLTHELYETRRALGPAKNNNDWRWDASSQQFRSAYLGHGLHLLEGIIQNLKDDLLRRPAIKKAGGALHVAALHEPRGETTKDAAAEVGEKEG